MTLFGRWKISTETRTLGKKLAVCITWIQKNPSNYCQVTYNYKKNYTYPKIWGFIVILVFQIFIVVLVGHLSFCFVFTFVHMMLLLCVLDFILLAYQSPLCFSVSVHIFSRISPELDRSCLSRLFQTVCRYASVSCVFY